MLTSHCKETKQPHKKFKVDCFLGGEGIYTDIPPVATALLGNA